MAEITPLTSAHSQVNKTEHVLKDLAIGFGAPIGMILTLGVVGKSVAGVGVGVTYMGHMVSHVGNFVGNIATLNNVAKSMLLYPIKSTIFYGVKQLIGNVEPGSLKQSTINNWTYLSSLYLANYLQNSANDYLYPPIFASIANACPLHYCINGTTYIKESTYQDYFKNSLPDCFKYIPFSTLCTIAAIQLFIVMNHKMNKWSIADTLDVLKTKLTKMNESLKDEEIFSSFTPELKADFLKKIMQAKKESMNVHDSEFKKEVLAIQVLIDSIINKLHSIDLKQIKESMEALRLLNSPTTTRVFSELYKQTMISIEKLHEELNMGGQLSHNEQLDQIDRVLDKFTDELKDLVIQGIRPLKNVRTPA